MKKRQNRLGFTLLEMLIVVAVVAILSGVAFVGVQNYQRNMTRLEMDSVAKEIFVAAQNHLTMAKTQNYLGLDPKENVSAFGKHGEYSAPDRESDQMAYFDGYFLGSDPVDNGVYYIIKNQEIKKEEDMPQLWGMMLPWGAVNESSRQGNYIIRYQPGSGRVLDVFYCNRSGRYSGGFTDTDYSNLMALRDAVNQPGQLSGKRMRYGEDMDMDMVVGWYGGAEAVAIRKTTVALLQPPEIEVINGDKLTVRVIDRNTFPTDTNDPAYATFNDYKLQLILTGLEANKEQNANEAQVPRMAIDLCTGRTNNGMETSANALSNGDGDGETPPSNSRIRYALPNDTDNRGQTIYEVTLDDITAKDMRFASINLSGTGISSNSVPFANGQNIRVQAQAFHTAQLGNIASSDAEITNSLFADLMEIEGEKTTAYIRSFRHLENLDKDVSNLYTVEIAEGASTKVQTLFTRAVQTTDLQWNQFMEGSASVYTYESASGEHTEAGGYYPINPTYELEYDGQSENEGIQQVAGGSTPSYEKQTTRANHSISNVRILKPTGTDSEPIAAGLFGAPTGVLTVENLELIDFSILPKDSTDPAFAGNAGALAGTLNGATVTNVLARNSENGTDATIVAKGEVGGLIGQATNCTLSKSAAALVVESTGGNAGGLIGSSSGGSVTACYSGGHTKDGKYTEVKKGTEIVYNVTSKGDGKMAGGLIGDADTTNIGYSYSTCSARGKIAGGFVGTAEGNINDCYATGLVQGTETVELADTVETTINDRVEKGVTLPKDGAFAYNTTGTLTNCRYFEIINERYFADHTVTVDKPDGKSTIFYLMPQFNSAATDGLKPLDESAEMYEELVGAAIQDGKAKWTPAAVYDTTLLRYYGIDGSTGKESKFNLKTVKELGATDVHDSSEPEAAGSGDDDSSDPVSGDPGTGDPGTTDPVSGDPGTGDPGTTDPVSGDPGTGDPGTTDPVSGDPGTSTPAGSDEAQVPDDFVVRHYGDWPAPEIFVFNS